MFSNFVCTDQINVCSMFFGSCDECMYIMSIYVNLSACIDILSIGMDVLVCLDKMSVRMDIMSVHIET